MHSGSRSTLSFRDFSTDSDGAWLHDLWGRTLHPRWAISFEAMLDVVSESSLSRVAVIDGRRAAICVADSGEGQTAAILLLLVEPSLQHRGIGTSLYTLLETTFRKQHKAVISLGAGDGDYFWPGIPAEQDAAWSFFKKQEFEEEEPSEDLIQSLAEFETPAWVLSRQAATGTSLHLAGPDRVADLLAFEQRHFPAWSNYFKDALEQGSFSDILYAQGKDWAISGTILMRSNAALPWLSEAGKQVGTLNTLGVAPDKQGQGIGLALTAGAMHHLRLYGCSSCFIQWTGLAEWYAKLGARPWARYRMAVKPL